MIPAHKEGRSLSDRRCPVSAYAWTRRTPLSREAAIPV
jgi:hypothetical protein